LLTRSMISGMFHGLIWIVGIVLVASFVISLLLSFTPATESSFSLSTMVISFLALFIGGIVSGKRGKEKGWVVGAGTGLVYALLVFFIQYLGYGSSFSPQQYLFFGLYILAAALGGVIGVNLSSERHKK
jgi:putative membrane protein (TIGR04086 family)